MNMKKLSANLLLALICVIVLLVGAELVMRASYTPPARTLTPNVSARTTTSKYDVTMETNAQGFRDSGAHPGLFGGRVAVMAALRHSDRCRAGRCFHVASTSNRPFNVWNFGVPGTGHQRSTCGATTYARSARRWS
jgi:hypothetical protein